MSDLQWLAEVWRWIATHPVLFFLSMSVSASFGLVLGAVLAAGGATDAESLRRAEVIALDSDLEALRHMKVRAARVESHHDRRDEHEEFLGIG